MSAIVGFIRFIRWLDELSLMPARHLGLGQPHHARPNEPFKIALPRHSANPLIQIKVTFNLNPNLNYVSEHLFVARQVGLITKTKTTHATG